MSGVFDTIGSFLFGNGNKGTSTTNSTQTKTPYAPTVAPIASLLSSNAYNDGTPQISPLEQSGYNAVSQVANNPTAAYTDAGTQLDNTINGDYLTPDTNPYLADIAKRVGATALQTTNSQFGAGGRSLSGLSAEYAGQGVGNALTDLYGQEYNTERGLQNTDINAAPAYQQSQYLAPQALISAGQNVSARPFDITNENAGMLAQIANLGGTATGNLTTTTQAPSNGLIGNAVTNIANSFTNKLFPSSGGSGGAASALAALGG